jgi:LysM repeat protein
METKDDQPLDENEKSTLNDESESDDVELDSLFEDEVSEETTVSREEFNNLIKGVKKLATNKGREAKEEVKEVVKEAPAAAEEANLQTYTVKEGEDVYAVAIRWGVSPKEITALNNLKSIELEPGTVLKIPSVK